MIDYIDQVQQQKLNISCFKRLQRTEDTLVGWLVGCISQDTYLLFLSQPHSGEEGEDQTAELGEEAEPDEAGQDGFGV